MLNKIIRTTIIAFLPFLSFGVHALDLEEFKNEILKTGTTKGDFRDSHEKHIWSGLSYPRAKNSAIGCGCSLKNRANQLFGQNDSIEYSQKVSKEDVISKRSIMLYGDSRFQFIWEPVYNEQWGRHYQYAAVGGSTSGDLKRHFDRCSQRAGWNYVFTKSDFFPAAPGMTSLQHPARDDVGILAPVQLENTTGFVITGGNDFNLYKPILKVFPFLIPLRINNIINNLNRLVSYHQAQDSNLVIVSQLPLPSGDDRGAFEFELDRTLHSFRKLDRFNELNEMSDQSITEKNVLDIQSSSIYLNSEPYFYAQIYELHLAGGIMSEDRLWVSYAMKHVSMASMVLVSKKRRTGFVDLWSVFRDPATIFPFAYNEYYFDSMPKPISLKDGVHPSFTGNLVMISEIRDYAHKNGLERDRAEEFRDTGDRCQVIDENYLISGQPAKWTPEPEPLPEADDGLLGLLTLCFLTGHCK